MSSEAKCRCRIVVRMSPLMPPQRIEQCKLCKSAPLLLAAIKGMFEWQRGVQEFMPDELLEAVHAALAAAEARS